LSRRGETSKIPIIIIGAGGHASVVADTLRACGDSILGFTDIKIQPGTPIIGNICVLGTDDLLSEYDPQEIKVAIGIGYLPGQNHRRKIFHALKDQNHIIKSLIHPSAIIGQQVDLQEGSQVMAGTVVQPRATIGKNVIINTGARIDHDSTIGDHSHIAPGVTVCGDVSIGRNCFVGAGATIIHGINIGENAIIAAGVTAYKDILPEQVYVGRKNIV